MGAAADGGDVIGIGRDEVVGGVAVEVDDGLGDGDGATRGTDEVPEYASGVACRITGGRYGMVEGLTRTAG